MKKSVTLIELIVFGIIVFSLLGYLLNIVKLVKCDFKAPYKAEVIRGIGACSGLGMIIGYINIEDGNNI